MAQYLWPQDHIDDIKRDPCQRAFSSGVKIDLRERCCGCVSDGMTLGQVDEALASVPPKEATKIRKVLYSKGHKFNCNKPREIPVGIALEIPDLANQYAIFDQRLDDPEEGAEV